MTLPRKSTLFPNVERDSDVRGSILSIVDEPVQNVSIITCNPGSIRSNHWHYNDFHFMYIIEGEIDYFYKDVDDGSMQYLKVRAGDNIFTPDNELHATYFPVKTVMVVSSKFPRDQETYEKDTVREPLITAENIEEMLATYAH
jgi:oxalate decarboxylase/phosphoglucose isomerase-like protein (cupin superfamily)